MSPSDFDIGAFEALHARVIEKRRAQGLISIYRDDDTGEPYELAHRNLEAKRAGDAFHGRRLLRRKRGHP